MQFEYGPDYAWAPLKGQCPEVNQAQYTYRLCLFDRAVQKDRNGHHEVGLGNWRGWEGSDDSKYSIQKYADGQVNNVILIIKMYQLFENFQFLIQKLAFIL